MTALECIEGIGPKKSAQLRAAGIGSCEKLLTACCDKKGRKAMAAASGLDEKSLLEWANRADLMRIKGVSTQFSDLLEVAGVDTVKELAKRVPENLAATMAACNDETKARTGKTVVRRAPSVKEVAKWVAQAKQLPAVIKH